MRAKYVQCKKGPGVAVAKKCWNLVYARWNVRTMPQGTEYIVEDNCDGTGLGKILWCTDNAGRFLGHDINILSGYLWLVTPMRPL